MEAQVPGPVIRLSDLPSEVLGVICFPLSLKDRVALSSTCRALLHGLASSEDAWGRLEFRDERTYERLPSLLAWLARRRQGLRHLDLDLSSMPQGGRVQAATQLAACLEGSPLIHLQWSNPTLFKEEGGAELQWLGSCTALTSLTLIDCELSCLPGALEQLPALAELSLAQNNLKEATWALLRHLAALTRLDLSWCSLAALPEELAALPALAELNLAFNQLQRASWAPLGQLNALTSLNVRGCGLAMLPAELAALPALAALSLGRNGKLGAAEEEAWAPLAQCSCLASLGLDLMSFTRLPAALAALAPHLVDLNLGGTNEGGLWASSEAAQALGPLWSLTGLTRLNLRGCLTDSPPPEKLSCLAGLQDLDLSYCYAVGGGQALRHLCCLTALTRLSLKECSIEEVPEEIQSLQALKDLDLTSNAHYIHSDARDASWQRLLSLTALTRLKLHGWNLGQLPPALAQLRFLAELDLTRNPPLGGLGATSAADASTKWAALVQLTALTHLDASGCELHTVPTAFAALPRLRVLCLRGNASLGRGGVEALRPLARMTALQHLDLRDCSLPQELETDAVPFPLHRLEGWAEQIEGLSEREIWELKLG